MSPVTIVILAAGALAVFVFFSFFRYIPNDRVGIVERRLSPHGSVPSGFIALHGEAGFQPAVLRGGWHVFTPFVYRIHRVPLVTIPQGHIGYVFARDGHDLPATQSLARNVETADFTDVVRFLEMGGQKGPQRAILREGTYAINLAQFVVLAPNRTYFLPLDARDDGMFAGMSNVIEERGGFEPVVIKGDEDHIGVVTVHDGPSLGSGEIIAPTVGEDPRDEATFHNNFQDADKFLAAGGRRGRQLQVLVEGTWYINCLFATVERIKKTVVEVGTVGVVVSYTGEAGIDLSGKDYRHGELVAPGKRGVWSEPTLPGKYAFNTYAGRMVMVPTTNFILKWNRGEMGAHRLDENLSEVSLITKDAFEPTLPLSVVVHIDYRKAPLVVQRFGDVKRLVEQTLDPMVSAYFKNVGQTRTLIQLIQERSEIQQTSGDEMKAKFLQYNLELQEVLIGTPGNGQGGQQIEEILKQLRSRQIAAEQVETYTRQQRASEKERELREAEARARQQTMLTESEVQITVQSNQGKADVARAQQEASRIQTLAGAEAQKTRLLAEGEAQKIRLLAESEADKTARVGVAQALAIEEQVRAYGGPQYQLVQEVMNRFAAAIETAKVDVVPKIQMGGSGGANGSGGGIVESLLSILMSQRLAGDLEASAAGTPRDPAAQSLRDELLRGMRASPGGLPRA
ncbi:MAG: SPFH domain-containing protein [Myxococcota bacterium]